MAGEGMSRYRAVRVTLTAGNSGHVFVSVTAKGLNSGWDQWHGLVPTRRKRDLNITGVPSALEAIVEVIEEYLDSDEDDPM